MDVLSVYIFVYIIPSADGALPRPWAENKVTWCMRKLQQLMSLQDWRRNMDIAGRCQANLFPWEANQINLSREHMLEVYGTYTILYLYCSSTLMVIWAAWLTFRKGRTSICQVATGFSLPRLLDPYFFPGTAMMKSWLRLMPTDICWRQNYLRPLWTTQVFGIWDVNGYEWIWLWRAKSLTWEIVPTARPHQGRACWL